MNFFLKWECQNGHAKFIYHEYMINAAGACLEEITTVIFMQ